MILLIILSSISGDRQTWATPKPPPQQVISKGDPLAAKPYGVFSAQYSCPPSVKEDTKDKPEAVDSTSDDTEDPSEMDSTEFNGNVSEYTATTKRRKSGTSKERRET